MHTHSVLCLKEQQFKTHLVQSNSAPNTLPWSIGNRKPIGAADPLFVHAPVGEGDSLSPVPKGKNSAAPQAPQLAALRGSPIANIMGRHASQAWINVPIPH
jgi:hypothetical protein